ncbi:MAG: element excision factor XisI family protein [Bacteroidota bacterium]
MVKALDKKAILENFIQEYIYLPNEDFPHLRQVFSKDTEEKHFILTCTGWNGELHTHYTVFHFELQNNGIILVHENRTDNTLDDWFEEHGISSDTLIAAWGLEPEEKVA